MTPAEENNKETGGKYIIEKLHTVDALTELTDTRKSTSLHLAIAYFLQHLFAGNEAAQEVLDVISWSHTWGLI